MQQRYQRQNTQMKKLIRRKKPNGNIVLSIIFISLIIIAFLILFAVNGQKADGVSGRPTRVPTQAPSMEQGNPTPTPIVNSKVIVIDPGHGGYDNGALGSTGMKNEDDLNLAIALKVGAYLSDLGFTPIYTRTTDDAVLDLENNDQNKELQGRVNIINSSNALLAVSIHMNSYTPDSSVRGPEVYYYDENASAKESSSWAVLLQAKLNEVSSGRRSCKAEDFMVLRDAKIPAVLIECGFLTCPTEEQKLNDNSYQDKIAKAIADCIAENLV